MITKKTLLLCIILQLVGTCLYSQQLVPIKGNVIDEDQQPLIGVSVAVMDTARGAVSDSYGNFVIDAKQGDELSISCVGYATQIYNVGTQSNITIVMQPEAQEIEDLVVIGYGVQKKANLTGSVSTVNYAEAALSRPLTSTAQALQGASAGMMVSQASGQPGAESLTIRIRGVGTLNNSAPLVVIDGFEGTIGNVSPDDIESVSVLKDAASCAIYGNRGANGVILITTKKGSKDRVNITYSGVAALNRPASYFKTISNYADYMAIMNESAENIGSSRIFSQTMIDLWREKEQDPNGISDSGYPNYVAYPNTDWMSAMFENNIYQKHNISASGASDKINYLLSFSAMDNPGIMANSAFSKYQFRTNVSAQVTKWLEIGTRVWGHESSRELNDFAGASGFMSRAVPGIYPYYDGKYGWLENPEQSSASRNNLYFANRSDGEESINYSNMTLYANIKLPANLQIHTSFNRSNTGVDKKYYTKTGNAYSFSKGDWAYRYEDLSKLYLSQSTSRRKHWSTQSNINGNWSIGGKHDISALLGFEAMYYKSQSSSARKTGFAQDQLVEFDTVTEATSIDGTQTDYASASYFSRATYAYDNRYLMEVNLRADGSSRFASKSRWGFFPSVSAGWRVSEEEFMSNSAFDNLKLRASWGKLGNNAIGNYEYQATYSSGSLYSFGGTQMQGLIATLSNDNLEWETTTSTNVGLEVGVLDNRLTLETDIYNRVTDNILYAAPIYATIGNKAAPMQNLCEVTNRGVELSLSWRDRVGDFTYGVSTNFTRNYNKVTKYKGALEASWVKDKNGFYQYVTNIGDVTTSSGTRRIMEGKLINEYYLLDTYTGDDSYYFGDGSVNPNGGPSDGMIRTQQDMEWAEAMLEAGNTFLPNKELSKNKIWYGDYLYADTNGDGIYGDENDYTFQNVSMTPKFYYGLQLDLAYKGFDLSSSWAGAGGFSIYWRYAGFNGYGTRADLTLPEEIAYDHYFFDPENPTDPRTNITSKHGRLTMNYGSEQNGGSNYSTLWLYKGDYLKLKNLTLGYTVPSDLVKRIRLNGLRVYVSGENLWTITDYPGMDPEFASTTNYYASLKQYSVGINVKF